MSTKYLIEDNSVLYTIQNGALVVVSGSLTAATFMSDGFDDLSGAGAIIMQLTAPTVHAWNATDQPQMHATLIAVPYPQSIISQSVNLIANDIVSVDEINISYTGAPLVSVEVDNDGWMKYDGNAWVIAADGDGMQIGTLTSVTTAQWATLFSGKTTFRLRATLTDEYDSITELQFVFLSL